jgi:transcriptional regulator with XRE-family HTH domain
MIIVRIPIVAVNYFTCGPTRIGWMATETTLAKRKKGPRAFGAQLARMRRQRDVTQAELARLAGITRAMVVSYETGKVTPPGGVLPRIAGALGVSIDALFKHDPSTVAASNSEELARIRRVARAGSRRRKRKGEWTEVFGRRLSRLRQELGLTQRELGVAVGISSRMIAYYETEKGNPPLELLPKLAKALRVSIDGLLGVETGTAGPPPRNARLWRKLMRLEELPDRKRRVLVRLIDEMLEEPQEASSRSTD